MTRILVADNDEKALQAMAEIIRGKGYTVIMARNPESAKRILDSKLVDLAVLDLRLRDNKSNKDISGLALAKETDPSIPKIIASQFEDFAAAREALTSGVDGLPTAIDFVPKSHLKTELLPAIERALELMKTTFRRTQEKISEQLNRDYKHARNSALAHTWVSFLLAIIFVIPVGYGVFVLHGSGALTMVFIFIGSLGAEITNYIFARKTEFLYHRVDRFHTELLQAGRFEQLLAVCDDLGDATERTKMREKVLDAALSRWIAADNTRLPLPPGE
jgi:CheY-like chemotaxis protein